MKKLGMFVGGVALALTMVFSNIFVDTNSTEVKAASVVKSGTWGHYSQWSSETGEITYTLDDEGTLTLSGTGCASYDDASYTLYCPIPWGNNGVKKVVISEGITSLRGTTAYLWNDLKEVYLPKSLTFLDPYAFSVCSNLSDVYFAGTEEQWNTFPLKKGDTYMRYGYNNSSYEQELNQDAYILSANIHCNYVEPEVQPTETQTVAEEGLKPAGDGQWYLVKDGQVVESYTGLYCDANVGWWLVKNGRVAFEYNDLYGDANYGWWKITNGAVDFNYCDLYGSPTYGWWLVYGGAVIFDYNDLFGSPQYGWWKVTNGAVDFNYCDLYGSPTCGWWLVYGGNVIFNYSDLFYSPQYGWWKVNGGAVDFGYTGVYDSPTFGPWNINGGAVVF